MWRRSWKLGVDTGGLDPDYVWDTARVWQAGARGAEFPKLEEVAAFLLNQPTVVEPTVYEQMVAGEHEKAADQIRRKLYTIRDIAQKMGVIATPEVKTNSALAGLDWAGKDVIGLLGDLLDRGDETEEFVDLPEVCTAYIEFSNQLDELTDLIKKQISDHVSVPRTKELVGVRIIRSSLDKDNNFDGYKAFARLYF